MRRGNFRVIAANSPDWRDAPQSVYVAVEGHRCPLRAGAAAGAEITRELEDTRSTGRANTRPVLSRATTGTSALDGGIGTDECLNGETVLNCEP